MVLGGVRLEESNKDYLLNDLIRIANSKLKQQKSKSNSKRKLKVNNKKKSKEELNKVKKEKANAKQFKNLLSKKDNLNDLSFFKNEMEIVEQDNMIIELEKINHVSNVDKPYRILLLESKIPQIFKISALKKISIMEKMDPSIGEYFKLKQWVDTFMCIPFNKYSNLPVSIDDGIESCNTYMENAVKTLDDAVFGLNDAKMQIMQLIGHGL